MSKHRASQCQKKHPHPNLFPIEGEGHHPFGSPFLSVIIKTNELAESIANQEFHHSPLVALPTPQNQGEPPQFQESHPFYISI